MRSLVWLTILCMTGGMDAARSLAQEAPVDYDAEVAPLLRKYCGGCHNDTDRDGSFSLESYASLMKGTEQGPALLPGDVDGSRIVRLITGSAEPRMPPDGEAAPNENDIALLKRWILQGAPGPPGMEPDRLTIRVPTIPSRTETSPITALDFSPDGTLLAIGRFGQVTVLRASGNEWSEIRKIEGLPGKVNAVHFCFGGERLVTASGVDGSGGIATLWDWRQGTRVRDFVGHRDTLFDAEVSPDGTVLATCSYDRQIILWNLESGEQLRSMQGHNGAVYDLAFSPDGSVLVSASADDTCKVWRVRDGERLDTLGQPLKEQYSVTFSPDGKVIAAGGADNRIRIWRFVSKERPRINPLVHARFAHEGPIVQLAYTPDGSKLISVAEDRTIKVWETENYTELELKKNDPEVCMALAVHPRGEDFALGRLDGSLQHFRINADGHARQDAITPSAVPSGAARRAVSPMGEMTTIAEVEPNDTASQAQVIPVPVTITGTIHNAADDADHDCFRFSARAGEEWVVEVNAARSKSPLDSYVDILTIDGEPIERLQLQAVRDSYFTFRGKNADQANDFRIFNWEEMELNEYLYANGEVVKLWLSPRGPDSGFNVYPGEGKRWGFFDTTPLSHALGEPCYIVRPYPPGTVLIPNGLPVFKLFYENDDECRREFGTDSKLFFTAPADGEYVLRLRDVRGLEGEDFAYKLIVRPPQRDFSVSLETRKLTIARGSGNEIRFAARRVDQFDGPMAIHVQGFPEGYIVTSPITIEAGQIDAKGVILAGPDAPQLDAEALKKVTLTATATIDGEERSHTMAGFEEIKLVDERKLAVRIVPAENGTQPLHPEAEGPLEFVIHPGETIMLKVQVERNGHDDVISFGNEFSGRNLPHGVFVGNIGLNGLLLLADQNEREFFVTASGQVPEQTRMFHLQTGAAGGHATAPVILHVRPRDGSVAAGTE